MKLLGIIVFSLVSIVITINTFFYHDQLITNWKKEYHWHRMVFHSKSYETLFLGDSRTYYGVNPGFFKDAHLYSFPSNSYSMTYLDRAEKHLNPKGTIILGITAESLTNYNMNFAIDKHTKYKLAYFDLIKCVLRVWWPHWDLSVFFKRGWDAVKFKAEKNTFPIKYHANGWWEAFPNEKNPNALVNHYKRNLGLFPFQKKLLDNLLKKIKQWKKQEITIYAFYPPASKSIKREEDNYANSRFDRSKIKETLIKAGVHWIEVNSEDYKTFDGDHLGSLEAIKLSQYLRNYINNQSKK